MPEALKDSALAENLRAARGLYLCAKTEARRACRGHSARDLVAHLQVEPTVTVRRPCGQAAEPRSTTREEPRSGALGCHPGNHTGSRATGRSAFRLRPKVSATMGARFWTP